LGGLGAGSGSAPVPPHNLDAEQGLLASIILEGGGEILNECVSLKVRAEYFFKPEHQLIYEAMLRLSAAATAMDSITLCETLHKMDMLEAAGGAAYISVLCNRIEVVVGWSNWLAIVREKYFRRKIIRTAALANEMAHASTESLPQLLDGVEKSFFEIAQEQITGDTLQHIEGPAREALDLIEFLSANKGAITGVPTGFKELDQMCFGLHPGQMIVVAARPGMGKTSIALNFIEAALFNKHGKPHPTLLFSLEMPSRELAMRLLCSRARAKLGKIREGLMKPEDKKNIVDAVSEYKDMPLLIDDQGGQTILEIRAKARRIAHQQNSRGNPLALIVIDYLQLINGTDSRVSREQQIAEASRSIKAMAKEFNLPVIALAQLNRKSEDENRAPRISDLRESGSIEQDADMVLLIDRVRKAGAKKKAHGQGADDEPEAEELLTVNGNGNVVARTLIVAKQRNGPTGEVPLHFFRDLTRFEAVSFNNPPHSPFAHA
jgi:replicative DNA helicase